MQEHHGARGAQFGSKIGFSLASVGSAIGMGNIWMFPYRVGQYGGAAFLITYFLFVALFGAVGLSGEFALGRLTGTGPVGSYDYAMRTRGLRGGKVLGAIPLLGSFGIAIGYSVIVGWVLRSAAGAATGGLFAADSETFFSQMTGRFGSVPWHLAVVALTVLFLAGGVIKGIEKANRVMMPAFFVLFIIIAVRVAFLPGAGEGYRYLFVPKWSALLDMRTWIMAMGQAFFSLSITGSGMIIYGSYLGKSENIPKAAGMTAFLDSCAALLAGFAIIPAVFAFGLDPTSGPPLMFITLPKVINISGGPEVLFAGITSLVNMFEVCAEAIQRYLKWPRSWAAVAVGALVFGVGVFLEAEPDMGKWMDMITIYVVPFGALLGAVMIYWVLGMKNIVQELNLGREKPIGRLFAFCAKYVYILFAAVVFVLGILLGGIG